MEEFFVFLLLSHTLLLTLLGTKTSKINTTYKCFLLNNWLKSLYHDSINLASNNHSRKYIQNKQTWHETNLVHYKYKKDKYYMTEFDKPSLPSSHFNSCLMITHRNSLWFDDVNMLYQIDHHNIFTICTDYVTHLCSVTLNSFCVLIRNK